MTLINAKKRLAVLKKQMTTAQAKLDSLVGKMAVALTPQTMLKLGLQTEKAAVTLQAGIEESINLASKHKLEKPEVLRAAVSLNRDLVMQITRLRSKNAKLSAQLKKQAQKTVVKAKATPTKASKKRTAKKANAPKAPRRRRSGKKNTASKPGAMSRWFKKIRK